MSRPAAPPGNYAALEVGARLLGKLECGNYNEETMRAWALPGRLVVIEWSETRRLVILASDELVVTSKGFVAANAAGIETDLRLVADGKTEHLTHCELTSSWGGSSDDDMATFARLVATESGCKVTVVPIEITDSRGGSNTP